MILVALALSGCEKITLTPAEHRLQRLWADPHLSVRERATAVNQCFTNGTPIRRIIEVLGTSFIRVTPYSLVSVDGSKITCWLEYKFGDESVTIDTTAGLGLANPESSDFTGAGYSMPLQNVKYTPN
jgi:hypothetical protein